MASRRKLMSSFQRKKFGFYRPHTHLGFDNFCSKTGEYMPSMTRQTEMEACDIHNILKQFSQRGFEELVRQNAAAGQYNDLTDLPDYQEALDIVIKADTAFAALPSQIRERFSNNPQRFVEFLADPANQDEAINLGLATDTRPPPPPPKPPAESSAPPADPPKK
ncbi:internal scaffolding protein [Blackfly microvirus SF02]|uniref:Internal scaffolding protein n=1 Tax=Blackfly microvirus SF02 TaxID=2576452 RepID=A0A4P8PLQ8_9VIRU|nr:internal scaffolding protein [Blackfly microvirus SF02]